MINPGDGDGDGDGGGEEERGQTSGGVVSGRKHIKGHEKVGGDRDGRENEREKP